MNNDQDTHELSRIAKRVEELIDQNKGREPKYLVSALGNALGDDLKRIKELTQSGLNDFIRQYLSHRFALEKIGTHGNIAVVVDRSEQSGPAEEAQTHHGGGPRFHPRFWAAFLVPLKEGNVRIFHVDQVSFEDRPTAEAHSDALTIPTEFIAGPGEERDVEKVKNNIARWLEQNGLEMEKFLAYKRFHSNTHHQPVESLLSAVLAALDQRQLQSTSLTLDVVAALLRAPRN